MATKSLLIKKFKTTNQYYIYDAISNAILNVDKNLWDSLISADFDSQNNQPGSFTISKDVTEEIQQAQAEGLLLSKQPQIRVFDIDPAWKEKIHTTLGDTLTQVTLNVTEACNFRCKYCAYGGSYKQNRTHSSLHMDFHTAKRAIDFGLQRTQKWESSGFPTAIGFYGGEPLLKFELIQRCVDYCNQNYPDRNIQFNMTTNGSLIDDESARFLARNGFSITLSCDGPQIIHDRYRVQMNGSQTFDLLQAGLKKLEKFSKKSSMRIKFNCVYAPPYDLLAIESFFEKLDYKYSVAAVMGGSEFYKLFDMKKEMEKLRNQDDRIFERYLQNIANNSPESHSALQLDLYEKDMIEIHKRSMQHLGAICASNGQCIPGGKKIFVGVRGDIFPCERVSEKYVIGNVFTGYDFERVVDLLISWNNLFSKQCQGCWAVRFCMKCFTSFEPESKFMTDENAERLRIFCKNKRNRWALNLQRFCAVNEIDSKYYEKMMINYYSM